MANEYRYIGKNVTRKDAKDIVTGKAVFLDDYKVPGMLYAKNVKSAYAHANIINIDTSKAEALKGVHAVLTYKNIPEKCKDWSIGFPPHRPILDSKVRAVGELVAAVAAETPEIAEAACELIEVEYEVLDAVYWAEDAVKEDAPQLYDHFEGNEVPYGMGIPGFPFEVEKEFTGIERGDVDKAFEECDGVAEGTASYDRSPAPLAPETPGVIAKWIDDNRLKMWATSQSPNLMVAQALTKMPGVLVDVESFNVGGSYGNKNHMTAQGLIASALAWMTRKPVKLVFTKSEQLLSFETRLSSMMKLKVGIKDGIVNAMQGNWLIDTGMTNDIGQCQLGVGLGEMQLAVAKCKNWDFNAKIIATNKIPAGVVRGFGGQELKATMMPIIAQAAAKANVDPVELFKKNFVQAGDTYQWRDGHPWTCVEANYVPAIEATAESFGWKEKFKGWYKPTRVEGRKAVGVGVSVHGNADVGEDNSEAYVRIDPYGFVVLQTTISEAGQGQRNNCAKMVAEILNVPFEMVKISPSDTLVNPHEFGLVGSRGTLTCGTAVTRAAEDAKAQLLEIGAKKFGVSADQVDTKDGFIFLKDNPQARMPWIAAVPFNTTITGFGRYEEQFAIPNFCIIFMEVEVDLDTGHTRILNIAGGTDVGQIIDPATLEMQFHGGFGSAAIDTGFFDEHVLDERTGRMMTSNLIDYKWRLFNEFPEYKTTALESQFNVSRFRALGFGEISGAPGPAAAMMAISNAIGKEFLSYPATPAAILKALEEA